MSESQTTAPVSTKTSNDVDAIAEQFSSVLNTLSSFKSQISMLSAQVKCQKNMKQLQREAKKKIKVSNQASQDFLMYLWENLKDLRWLAQR